MHQGSNSPQKHLMISRYSAGLGLKLSLIVRIGRALPCCPALMKLAGCSDGPLSFKPVPARGQFGPGRTKRLTCDGAKNGVGDSEGAQLWVKELIQSRGFVPSKRFISSIKSLEEGVFGGLEGDFGHVIPEADVVFVHFSWPEFQRGGGAKQPVLPTCQPGSG